MSVEHTYFLKVTVKAEDPTDIIPDEAFAALVESDIAFEYPDFDEVSVVSTNE